MAGRQSGISARDFNSAAFRPVRGRHRLVATALNLTIAVVAVAGSSAHGVTTAYAADAYASAVLGDGPSLYLRLGDAGCCTASDASGNNVNGTYRSSGITYGVAGALSSSADTAVSAAGTGDIVSASDASLPLGATARSVELWERTTSAATMDLLSYGSHSSNNAFAVLMAAGDQVVVSQWGTALSFTAPASLADGNWHAITVTNLPSSATSVYIDGVLVGTQSFSGSLATTASGTLEVGNGNDGSFTGSLDEVAVYPSALTQSQVTNHFSASGDSVPSAPGNLVATAGTNQATVTWTAATASVPAGEASVAQYVINALVGNTVVQTKQVGGTATTATLTGLLGGTAYTFSVQASNAFGTGPAAASNAVTPGGNSAGSYAAAVLSDSPAVWYRLDETGCCSAADSSGHGDTGTYRSTGITYAVPGGIGSDPDPAVSATGTGDLVTGSDAGLPLGGSARSVELWEETTGTGAMDLVNYGSHADNSAFAVLLQGGDQVVVSQWGSALIFTAPYSLDDGTWHAITVTYAASSVGVYVDGQLLGRQSFSGPVNTTASGTLNIGSGNDGSFSGGLDEVAVYPTVLPQAQVTAHLVASGWALPSTPTAVETWAGPGSARISWSSPSDAALGYTITPLINGVAQTPVNVAGTLTSATIPGLIPGTAYTFQVVEHTHFGDSAPADPPLVDSAQLAWDGSPTAVGVYVGYGDSSHNGEFFPVPWTSGADGDNGAVLLTNTTSTPIIVDSVVVTIGTYTGTWGSEITVPAGGDAIAMGVDSSDLNGGQNCTHTGIIPTVQVTVGGTPVTYQDDQQVLNTGGWDKGGCPNLDEGNEWELVGGPRSTLESVDNFSENPTSCLCADPVDALTGDFSETYTDLSIGERGMALGMTRSYHSLFSGSDGPFGYGWSSPSAMFLATDGLTGAVQVHQETGSVVSFTPTANGYVAPSRVLASLVRNHDGSFTFTRKDQTQYSFDLRGELIAAADRDGNTLSYAYANGQLVSITDPVGRTLTLSYTNNRVSRVSDPAGRTVAYAYDGSGNLVRVADVNGGVTTFTYDANHLLLSRTDPDGATVTNTYDSAGRVTRQVDALGRTTTFAYAAGSTMMTSADGEVTLLRFTAGELVAKTEADGTALAATWIYGYDPTTLGLVSTTDPDGHTATATYDARGNLLTSTDALGRTTTRTYDAVNDLLTSTDPMGVTTTFTYDAKGNLTSVARPLVGTSQASTTTYHHGDPAHPGDVTAITDPMGRITTLGYDAAGDVTSTTDPAGDRATSTYNQLGWITSSTSPRGNVAGCGCAAQYTTTYAYTDPGTGALDGFGDVRVVTDPLGHRTTSSYDADRHVVASTDGDGNTTRYQYDLNGEPTATVRADGTVTRTEYTQDGQVQDEKDATGTAILTYGYDSLGRVTTTVDALGNQTTYSHDAAGNVTGVAAPGGSCTASPQRGCTTYGLDAAGELTGIGYSDGTTPAVTGITYNAEGERTGMHDGTGTWSWSWDSLGRLTGVTEGGNGSVGYQDNLDGQVTAITLPGGHSVGRGYDSAGRWTSSTDWLGHTVTFGYNPDGELTTQTDPANTAGVADQDGFSYDAAGRISAATLSKTTAAAPPVALFSATYSRDADGQVTADSSQPATVGSDGYTPLQQLCGAGVSMSPGCAGTVPATTAYASDAAGNLIQDGHTQQAFNAAGQLCWTLTGVTSGNGCGTTPTGATAYAYDSRGDRIGTVPSAGSATVLGYDQASRLTSWQRGSTTATSTYNGDGLRMTETVNGTPESFLWDVSAELPLLIGDGATEFVDGPGGLPVEQVSGSSVLYVHHDQLGSSRVLTDANGVPQATYVYDAYGNTLAVTGTATTQLRYAGQYQDAATGLYYLRARYNDPVTAQLLTRDPAVSTTRSPYAYVAGNPLNRTDPTGLYDYQHEEQIGTVQQTGGAAQVMHYIQTHMAEVFPFDTGACTQVVLGADCDLHPFPFVDDPVRITACSSTSFTFTTLGGSHQIGVGGTITFSTYEHNGFVFLQQTAHAPKADGITNVFAPIIAADTWQQMARRVRNQLGVGADGGPPLPGGLTPEECWSIGVCG